MNDHLNKLKQLLENAALDADTRREIRDTIADVETEIDQRLEQEHRSKYKLLRFLAGEYQTYLLSVQGYSKLLVEEKVGSLNSDQSQFLDVVLKNVDGVLTSLHSLRYLSDIKVYDFAINLEPVRVREIVDRIQNFCTQNDIRLPVRSDVDTSEVSIDSEVFQYFVKNLLLPQYPEPFLTPIELIITRTNNVIQLNFVMKEDNTYIETFIEAYHKLVEQVDNLWTFQDIYLSLAIHLTKLLDGKLIVEDIGDEKLSVVLEFDAH